MSEQMQMEEMELGFLGMEGGPEENIPTIPEEVPLDQQGLQQYNAVLDKVVSRFSGGVDEIKQLFQTDQEDIKQFKENQGPLDSLLDQETFDDDFDPAEHIIGSTPGQSLTGDFENIDKGQLGKYPWETPPEINTIGEAFDNIVSNKNENPTNKDNILKVLQAGAPAESIARTIGFQGFIQGTWTVDISELIVIPLMLEFIADAQDAGIDARIFNDFDDDEISSGTVLEIMEDLSPNQFNELKDEADMMSRMPERSEEEQLPEPIIGSFLDMEEV